MKTSLALQTILKALFEFQQCTIKELKCIYYKLWLIGNGTKTNIKKQQKHQSFKNINIAAMCSLVPSQRTYFQSIWQLYYLSHQLQLLSQQQQMSLDKRYDAFLSDLLTLFEEITLRYITQKPIDIQKFKHYFNIFYDRMQQLQTSFHESKLKITTLLNRLKESCSNSKSQTLDKMETIKRSINKKQASEQFAQSFIRSVSSKKKTDFSKKLGSIVEEDELSINRVYNKRSQTAADYRSYSHNDNRSQVRPKTGQTDSKRYALDKQTMNRTISVRAQQTQKSAQQQERNYEGYTLDAEQILKNKRKFYEELQKNKQAQISVLGKEQVKWIFGRKKSKSGWNKRINQLF